MNYHLLNAVIRRNQQLKNKLKEIDKLVILGLKGSDISEKDKIFLKIKIIMENKK